MGLALQLQVVVLSSGRDAGRVGDDSTPQAGDEKDFNAKGRRER
jgi:hypothetical protein